MTLMSPESIVADLFYFGQAITVSGRAVQQPKHSQVKLDATRWFVIPQTRSLLVLKLIDGVEVKQQQWRLTGKRRKKQTWAAILSRSSDNPGEEQKVLGSGVGGGAPATRTADGRFRAVDHTGASQRTLPILPSGCLARGLLSG